MQDHDLCPTCGRANDCAMARGEATCWCCTMPHVLAVSTTEAECRCYCRACLTRVIGDRTASDSCDRVGRSVDGPTVRSGRANLAMARADRSDRGCRACGLKI